MFVDYGSGKGKVVLWSQKKDILKLGNRYRGIDFDPNLTNIAKSNAKKIGINPSQFECADAIHRDIQNMREISYLYNPFDAELILELAYKLSRIESVIIYVNPIHEQLFIDAGYVCAKSYKSWHPNLNYSILTNIRVIIPGEL
jgi:SAM-dependent methyltransferase